VVEGHGLPWVNGEWDLQTRNKSKWWSPTYVKRGQWKGENCTFKIERYSCLSKDD
jgi:hypothetical protein